MPVRLKEVYTSLNSYSVLVLAVQQPNKAKAELRSFRTELLTKLSNVPTSNFSRQQPVRAVLDDLTATISQQIQRTPE